MENRLHDNEFEDFLKNQANQHRIYPSDQLWRNIQQEVHGYKKWPALTVIAVCIIAALVVGTVAVKPYSNTNSSQQTVAATATGKLNNTRPVTEPGTIEKNYSSHLSVDNISKQTIETANQKMKINEAAEWLILPVPEAATTPFIADNNTTKNTTHQFITSEENNNTTAKQTQTENNSSVALERAIPDARDIFSSNPVFAISKNDYHFIKTIYQDNPFYSSDNSLMKRDFNNNIPKTISNSALSRISKTSSKFDFQFYLTPSISYRRLIGEADNKLSNSYYITALPYASNYVVDLERTIQHRPGAGYEIGFTLGYNLGKKFAIRSGLQFNTRQYNIDAFVHSAEPASVSLSANNSSLVFNTVSAFRNIDGSRPIELKNRYYEIAIPVGIDWRPINGKFSWGIAASVQPTYTFDKEPFIITSNYKNYADGSQLMRNFNVNGNVETYLGYSTGKYRWQLGPQLRYQIMPTMGNSFPVREYPVDFGLKLGITRSLR